MRLFSALAAVIALSGCASQLYRDTPAGTFSGAVDVRWISNDYFLFLPNKDDPFTFTRANQQSIRPGPMYTDGGSIPCLLWGVEGLSPWGYAPAYIVHDWLFEAHQCKYPPDNQHTFDDSVALMAEGLKTLMEAAPEMRNYFVFDSVVAAVGSSIARRLWDGGACKPPPFDMEAIRDRTPPGELLMTIRFR